MVTQDLVNVVKQINWRAGFFDEKEITFPLTDETDFKRIVEWVNWSLSPETIFRDGERDRDEAWAEYRQLSRAAECLTAIATKQGFDKPHFWEL